MHQIDKALKVDCLINQSNSPHERVDAEEKGYVGLECSLVHDF